MKEANSVDVAVETATLPEPFEMRARCIVKFAEAMVLPPPDNTSCLADIQVLACVKPFGACGPIPTPNE